MVHRTHRSDHHDPIHADPSKMTRKTLSGAVPVSLPVAPTLADRLPLARRRSQPVSHWYHLGRMVRERLARYLPLLDLPSASDIQALADRVERLGRHLDANQRAQARELQARTLELQQRTATLAATRAQLEQANALATLAGMVPALAHDLSAPVGNANLATNTLQLRLQDFQAKVRSGELRRSDLDAFLDQLNLGLRALETAGSHIAELTNSLKHLSIDHASGRRRNFALGELVNEVLTMLGPSLRKASVRVEKDLDDTPEMNSYPGYLEQILINLLQNALLHAFAGRSGGTIQIMTRAATPGWVRILVSDDGVGMGEKVLAHLFTPFFTTRAHDGGSGLGLAYAKYLLENRLGGSITVTSRPGQGSHFVLDLPCAAPQ